jgi:hypothetical protein
MSVKVEVTIKEIPTACSKCQFYSLTRYRCHNEMGDESKCSLGYMTGDMRDVNMYTDRNREKRYFNCRIEDNILID